MKPFEALGIDLRMMFKAKYIDIYKSPSWWKIIGLLTLTALFFVALGIWIGNHWNDTTLVHSNGYMHVPFGITIPYLFSQHWILLIGIVVAFGVVMVWVSYRILKPLRMLLYACTMYEKCHYNQTIPIYKSDEHGTIANTLSRMAIKLQRTLKRCRTEQYEYNMIIESMREGLIAFDTANSIILLNIAAQIILNLKNQSYKGLTFDKVIDHTTIHQLVRDVQLQQPVDTIKREINIHGKTVVFYAQNIQSKEGSVIGTLLVFRDKSKEKLLENLRQEFVANVSHELKTPITTISGLAETILDGVDPKTSQHFIQKIYHNTKRLNNILDDLLLLTHIEAPQVSFQFNLLSPDEIIDHSVANVEEASNKKHISIQIFTTQPKSMKLRGNAGLLERAVTNLLDNAIKYSPDYSQIHVLCFITDNRKMVIEVKDQGIGIPEEKLTRIFERFYRVDKGRSRDLGGTGLGLSIVKHVTLMHRGHISVDSFVDQGSSFKLYFPIIEELE